MGRSASDHQTIWYNLDRRCVWLTALKQLLISVPFFITAYTTFCWYLFRFMPFWVAIGIASALFVVIAWILAMPSKGYSLRLFNWAFSNGIILMLAITVLSLATITFILSPVSVHLLVVLSAAILLRLDMQLANLKRWQMVVMLVLLYGTAIGTGWSLTQVIPVAFQLAPQPEIEVPSVAEPERSQPKSAEPEGSRSEPTRRETAEPKSPNSESPQSPPPAQTNPPVESSHKKTSSQQTLTEESPPATAPEPPETSR